MRPAFASTRQAAAFALLLLFLLAAPWLGGKNFLPSREQAYASEGWTWGPYPWIQRQIFEETNDIDIAFIGSSHLMWGIDTPYVQQKLDERLGRKTVVRSICWGGAGFDSVYFICKDLLENRRVKTLVFYDESVGAHQPNPEAPNWFRYGDDPGVLAGLPPRYKAIFYFAAMNGMPANLLELLTPSFPGETESSDTNYFERNMHADNPETRLGSVRARIGFGQGYAVPSTFIPFTPQTGVTPADALVYSPVTASNFVFLNQARPALEIYFAKKFSLLAQSHGCKLVLLHLPTIDENKSPKITESWSWPDFLNADVTMIGIPSARLFAGLSEPQIKQLYWDLAHLNQNGQQYFTPLITPAILQAYENRSNH